MLQASQAAPYFSSLNQDNDLIELADYKGQNNIILYFYPKDNTSGCTIEANEFTTLAGDFAAENTVVIGVSKDSCESHLGFIDKQGIQFDLLADTEGKLCEDYGVWQEKTKNGVTKMGIVRSTFVINKAGILETAIYGVTAKGHAAEMLALVKGL
ncbi:MAG: thioredoxin-dependent peroxiredoxin [Thiomicrorhabdus sp.]|nr:MAG: thioredoxin-dependent peroxiredoxin [Thiomicrorhabdus sp.]